ncbi:MAG TPA: TMEM175 family protein [Pyrinomonadaceae bacterium]|jgi:TMEM175 potassium channel family protein
MSKTRLEAFSDGVFAIVITLLILNVHVPDGRTVTLQSLRPLLPPLATFVLSFIMVGVYWIAHHHMLHFVAQVNRRLLWLNLLVLLCVVFIPFPASLLGTGFNNPLAVRLYGLTLIATNAAGLCFWLYSTSHEDLVVPHLTKAFARTVVKIHSSPMLGYALAIGLAGWSTKISLLLFALVPLFFIVPNPLLERRIGAATSVNLKARSVTQRGDNA